MYIPRAFDERDLPTLHAFIEQNSFGLVVSQVDGEPFGTHLPILLRRGDGPYGTLAGHFARANPQWRSLAGQTVLVVFGGPHVYVSPTWYEAANMVPTWNYTAVHAYGRIETVESGEELLAILHESVGTYEGGKPEPWTFDGTTTFAERLMEQIVGFRMEITRLEGKFKLNQNHPAERRERVVRALDNQTDENSRAVAELIRESLRRAK